MPLHILLVEDSEDDALLLLRELRRGGYEPDLHRVDSAEQLELALKSTSWDIVITDHNLPGFGSIAALQIVRAVEPDIPVIIVSGTIGEDVAVNAMKAGANDYIMKGNLARLAPAIERELREAQMRNQHRRAEETIHHLAHHDVLTGLFNRHRFEQRLKTALDSTKEWGAEHALLYLDLDQFKVVNDTCGHVAGDELLKQIALILHDQVREGDALARLGGDEFGMLLENCPMGQAEQVAEKLLQSINDFRFCWDGKCFVIGGSIGVTPIAGDTPGVDDLLRNADIACYAAKDRGRNRIQVYTEDDVDLARRRGEMHWVSRIQWALEHQRFKLFRQRIVPLHDGANEAPFFELLIRMQDENGQLIGPGAFLPAAERYNLAPAIDRWVVSHLLEFLRTQATSSNEIRDQHFFINLSGITLSDDGFYDFLHDQLAKSGVTPSRLCFEITETAAIGNLSRAVNFMEGIRKAGCRFALDDFGAGLSSFSYLKAIPVDYLKIDGALVRDITSDPLDKAIVDSINRVGQVAGLKTIAEFVENDAIRASLQEMGVDYAQGFGLHQPEPLDSGA